jgi:arylsulfatase A-like enzyme/Tfp pilus assembly protein PilF
MSRKFPKIVFLFPVLAVLGAAALLLVRPHRPNVLLITVDTLRADHLGCYGYALAQTPHIDALAAAGTLFSECSAATPITLPSHSSILTGLWPPAHGVRDNGTYVLADKAVTLAERLKIAGYETRAFVSAVVLARRYGLDQGFDSYDDDLWSEKDPKLFMIRERKAPRTIDRVVEWFEAWKAEKKRKPFFTWVHLFDPHQPDTPPAWARALAPTPYDAEIASADRELGRLFDALKEAGVLDDTIIVFTADHGESLGEHGEKTHAIFIYRATIHVPLIIRWPGKYPAGKKVASPVRSVDIVPTVLAALRLKGAAETQGVDLAPAANGRDFPADLPRYSESRLSELGFGMAPLYGIRVGTWSYIRAPRPELYDLRADPDEKNNIFAANASQAARLEDDLKRAFADCASRAIESRPRALNRETMEMLQSLGYLAPAGVRESLGGMDPKDGIGIYTALEDARHAMQRREWIPAEKTLREILAKVPRNVSARNILALLLTQSGRMAQAREEYLRSLADDPGQARVYLQLGHIALLENKMDEARRNFARASDISPGFVEAYSDMGLVEVLAGNPVQAREWYDKAVAVDPDFPAVYRRVGDLYYERGDFASALVQYEEAAAKSPDDFRSLVQAGNCLRRLGRPGKAEVDFLKAAQAGRKSWVPYYNLACLYALGGDTGRSAAAMRQSLKRGFNSLTLLTGDADLSALRRSSEYPPILKTVQERRHDVEIDEDGL